jgi:3-methyladenine DNA glycosylase/8-oxoguanine DNA glycosylase
VEPITRSIRIERPLDLRATLRSLHGSFAADGWWLAARTPTGAGSLRIRRTREDLIGDGWGDGASWLLGRLSSIGGLEDDPASFETDHPVVRELHRQSPGWRFGRTGLVFDALVHGVVGQKVTGQEAHAAMWGLRRRFGDDPAPGSNPGLRLPPDPIRMAEAPYWAYHELHLEKRRADVLRRVAAAAEQINKLGEMSSATAEKTLLGVPGIGPWTVSKTLAISHGDADQVDVGDFHLKHMVAYHLTGRARGTDQEMLELLEPFRPHRGRVARLLHSLGHEPKFGPRMAPRDITRI